MVGLHGNAVDTRPDLPGERGFPDGLAVDPDGGRDVGAHGSAVSAYGGQARLGLHPRSFARLARRDLANAALTKGTGERTYGLRRLIPNIPQSMVILAVSMAYIDQSGTFR